MTVNAPTSSFDESALAARVGPGFRSVAGGMLVEKGDQVEVAPGLFQSLPLEAVGQPVQRGCVVRRPESTRRLGAAEVTWPTLRQRRG